MGAWSSNLYGNDTTCDVRDTYTSFLEEQLSNQEAYERTLEKFHEYIGDEDEEPLFWFALAETQWKVGRLMPDVKNKALEWIEKDGGTILWEDSKRGAAAWKKTLEKLYVKLETEQRKEKKIRKPEVVNQNLWNIGDVYAYKFHTEISQKYGTFEKYMLIQKMGEEKWGSEMIMRIHIFDKLFDNIPDIKDIEKIRFLPFTSASLMQLNPEDYDPEICTNFLMRLWKNKEYPVEHLTFLANAPIPKNELIGKFRYIGPSWLKIEEWGKLFNEWHGIEYETVVDGVFRYPSK